MLKIETISNKKKVKRPLIFIDIETTGLDPKIDDIISMVAADDSGILLRYYTHPSEVNKNRPGLKVNGYTKEKWDRIIAEPDVLTIPSVAIKQFNELWKDAVIGGANPSFDVSFIKEMFRKEGARPSFYYKTICVENLYFALNGQLLSLTDLRDVFAFPKEGEHTAEVDVIDSVEMYKRMMEEVL